MGAAVIAGMDASPVLEFSEHVLDLVAAPVEHPVEGRRVLPVGFCGMQGGMRRAMSAWRNQSASYPLSPNRALAWGSASIMSAAPL